MMSEGHELPSERLEFSLQMPPLDPGGRGEIIGQKLACYYDFSHAGIYSQRQHDESTSLTTNTRDRITSNTLW